MSDVASPFLPGIVTGPPSDTVDATPYLVGQCPDCRKPLRGVELMTHFGAVEVGRGKTEVVPVCALCAQKRYDRLQREQAKAGTTT